jgi:hypothetical protein
MSRSDISAVAARRGAITNKLQDLKAAEARLQSEVAELDITVRVLERLGAADGPRERSSLPVQYVDAEPLHKQAITRLKNLLLGDPS